MAFEFTVVIIDATKTDVCDWLIAISIRFGRFDVFENF